MAMRDSEIFACNWCKNSTKLRVLAITQQKINLSLLFNINAVWGNKAHFFSHYPLQFSGFKNMKVTVINITNKNVKECLLSRKKWPLFCFKYDMAHFPLTLCFKNAANWCTYWNCSLFGRPLSNLGIFWVIFIIGVQDSGKKTYRSFKSKFHHTHDISKGIWRNELFEIIVNGPVLTLGKVSNSFIQYGQQFGLDST